MPQKFTASQKAYLNTQYAGASDGSIPGAWIAANSIGATQLASSIVAQILEGQTAYSWGPHQAVGYLTSENDPVYSASVAAGITDTQVSQWSTAYGWGNHATAGYSTTDTKYALRRETFTAEETEEDSVTLDYPVHGNGTIIVDSATGLIFTSTGSSIVSGTNILPCRGKPWSRAAIVVYYLRGA